MISDYKPFQLRATLAMTVTVNTCLRNHSTTTMYPQHISH